MKATFEDIYSNIPKFNKELEAKLDLLHSLLTPPEDLDENFPKWIDLTKVIKSNDQSQECLIAWNKFIADINGKVQTYHEKPFHEDYIKALSDLRDSLLPD